MKRSVSLRGLNPKFDNFLRAQIHDDANGMPLSVLSALARFDVDPWKEAAKLSELSREKATQRLTTLIASLPDAALTHPRPIIDAARLIKLLPRADRLSVGSADDAVTGLAEKVAVMALFMMFLFSLLAAHYIDSRESALVPQADSQLMSKDTVPSFNAQLSGAKPLAP